MLVFGAFAVKATNSSDIELPYDVEIVLPFDVITADGQLVTKGTGVVGCPGDGVICQGTNVVFNGGTWTYNDFKKEGYKDLILVAIKLAD